MTALADRANTELREATPLDRIEAALAQHEAAEMPVTHRFLPGMYVREIHIPAGTVLTSMRHNTRHPFCIMLGRIAVISDTERIIYEAPHIGITEPGTKRLLYAETDTVWITFHATDKTTVEDVAADILADEENPLLGGDHPNINQWRRELPPNIERKETP